MERSQNVTEAEAKAEKQLLRPHRKIAYALGNFFTVLAIAVWFPYNISFFQFVLGLSAKNAGNIVLIAQVGGAISTPLVGMWSDKCSCKIPGRRKIFHLIGLITLALVMFFLWYKCLGCSDASEVYQVIYFCCFAIIFQFSWASIQIGQLALLPEICVQKRTQVQLNSLRYSFTIIANLVVFGCFWLLLKFYSDDSSKNTGDKPLTPDDLNIFLVQ
uniref:Major facilitator superfamily associated domain-containing protein n=1 Tax=Amphimedon queenslandica TaxID=400682 RepID=A0A1X7T029_AMPQE